VPVVPVLGVLVCFLMLLFLPALTWVMAATWLVIGYAVYFGYARRRVTALPQAAE
jgi:APA family basic amino acid/polyamine antiporter